MSDRRTRPTSMKATENMYADQTLIDEFPEFMLEVGDPVRVLRDINGEVMGIIPMAPRQMKFPHDNDPED